MRMLGLYIHIPFCLSKCRYCGFNSRPATPLLVGEYLKGLAGELASFAEGCGRAINTVYLGGGTPTILSSRQMEDLLGLIHRSFRLGVGAEITVEANPGTLDEGKARRLLALGVNRVSLGFQSLRDDALRLLGRTHNASRALESFEVLRRSGFGNIGIDLIYALPGQTGRDWEEELRRVTLLAPEHLSLYALTVEKGTPLARRLRRGTLSLPSEEEEAEMYRAASALASEAGYEHYEISNYARPGFRCRHNLIYWTGGDYYGAGAGAHSFFRYPRPVRFANVRDPSAYVRRRREGRPLRVMTEELPERTRRAEALMLGLRLLEGIDPEAFNREEGVDPLDCFRGELEEGFARGWLAVEKGRLRLTMEGVLFSDLIFARLF